jgi:4'-phosphopantetheinyl transferase
MFMAPPPPTVAVRTPSPGDCHVWLVPVRHRTDWLDLLDGPERERAARLVGTPAEHVFVTSRGTQRLVGAHYLGIPPTEVRTDRTCAHCANPHTANQNITGSGTPHGRPRLRGAVIDYSVSHTPGWLVMAVTAGGLVGVDIEEIDSVPDTAGLARAALSDRERHRFDALPDIRRRAWLLSAWTRKEAAMKLTGLGLRAAPPLVDVSGTTVSASAVPGWPTHAIHLHRLDAPAGHVGALATTVPLGTVRRLALPCD